MRILGVTFFPVRSAMHGAIEWWWRGGWFVFQPFPVHGGGGYWWRPFLYWSPNATPWHHGAKAYFGKNLNEERCVCGGSDCTNPREDGEK